MEKYQLQALRDLPIEGVAERLGIEVTRHKALCPFHDDRHPSLSFSLRRNTFRCFACGAHGGTIDLVMKSLGKDFRQATEWLSGNETLSAASLSIVNCQLSIEEPSFDASRYERFFLRPFLNDEARRFLFGERRLDERVVRWYRLTSWRDRRGVPWLQIPYYDREGRLTGLQNRNLVPGAWPRFRFPAGAVCGIYNLPVLNLLRPGDDLWITEGCSDCWAMLSSGRKAIAIPSATLLTRRDKEQLSSLSVAPLAESTEYTEKTEHTEKDGQLSINLHMSPDRDEPGERLFQQLRDLLPNLQRHPLPEGCKDFSDYFVLTKQSQWTIDN